MALARALRPETLGVYLRPWWQVSGQATATAGPPFPGASLQRNSFPAATALGCQQASGGSSVPRTQVPGVWPEAGLVGETEKQFSTLPTASHCSGRVGGPE